MSKAASFRDEAAKRILVKDGAYGTLIQAEKLDGCAYGGDLGLSRDQRGNNDLLNLTCPKVIEEICDRFAASARKDAALLMPPPSPGRRANGRWHRPTRRD